MLCEMNTVALDPPVGPDDHARGSATAIVTLVEYGDFECTLCGAAYAFIQENRLRLGDRLRFVYRHFPMTKIHSFAQRASEAAESAGAQGFFWKMHDLLLTHQDTLENGYLIEYADSLGLDTERFLREMASHAHANHVRDDVESGQNNGVMRTPTFFINGIRLDPALSDKTIREALDEAIFLATN